VKKGVELSPERQAFLEELAAEIWRQHKQRTPTAVEAIIKDSQITLDFDDYGEAFDGLIEHKNGHFHIYCNLVSCGERDSGRARFTLAHELGHFFIDEHHRALASGEAPSHAYSADRPSELRIEREADCFASALLMPAEAFVRELVRSSGGLQAVMDIASTFRVSCQSAARRYVRCSERPCAMVMFRTGATPWWQISPALLDAGITGLLRSDRPVVRGSATDQAQNDTGTGKIREATSTASYWFWNISDGTSRDVIIREQAIRLGTYGVLTLLEMADPAQYKKLRGDQCAIHRRFSI